MKRPEDRPIRVLSVLHSMHVAGGEILVHDVVRTADPRRFTHAVALLDDLGPLGEDLRAHGFRVEVLGRKPGLDLRVPARLAALMASWRPDVVHAHQYTPYSYAVMAAAALGPVGRMPKLVFTEHGRHYPDVRRPKRVAFNRTVALPITSRITAVAGFIKACLVDNEGIPAGRIEVLYNGVDAAPFDRPFDRDAVRASLGLEPHHRVVACIARFAPVKDHAMLVRAFARVAPRFHDARLALVGTGPLEDDIRAQVAAAGIADRVIFTGVRRDVPDVLRSIEVFALASVSEGNSVTILEAMLAARPVVATAVGGNPEVVLDGGTGLLSPRGDDAAFAESLAVLLADPARGDAMGRAGRERCLDRFLRERMRAAFARIYEDVVA